MSAALPKGLVYGSKSVQQQCKDHYADRFVSNSSLQIGHIFHDSRELGLPSRGRCRNIVRFFDTGSL